MHLKFPDGLPWVGRGAGDLVELLLPERALEVVPADRFYRLVVREFPIVGEVMERRWYRRYQLTFAALLSMCLLNFTGPSIVGYWDSRDRVQSFGFVEYFWIHGEYARDYLALYYLVPFHVLMVIGLFFITRFHYYSKSLASLDGQIPMVDLEPPMFILGLLLWLFNVCGVIGSFFGGLG
jgi:hypothetical protein